MRILIVSSHFPPNFVSGGTLVPYRAALGLAARGHEVSVYAGRIDPSSPDLVVTEERTDDGLAIRWVTCTSATEWAADENFSNGEVEADFAAYLQATEPDVVHLHALQGFGGGLVPLARASGAAVVVTMHDLWWWCARQFMVEPSMHPCPVVPAAGLCPCARDNAWLRTRNHRLAAQVRTADLVLTPSASMRRILVANGVDPARVRVDENGVPEDVALAVPSPAPAAGGTPEASAPVPTGRTGPLRLMFAGGQHPLKGGPLLLDAAATLVDRSGWTLDMYGWEGRPVPAHLEGHVRFRAPYAHGDAPQVLAAHDALVLPSLARESYSLLAREALRAGLPVITSDTPGPTEAVHDGVNGLVVPIGDAAALAAAMDRLIREPGLLAALAPDRTAIRLRSVDEQVDGNVAEYERLLAEREAVGTRSLTVTDRPLPPIRRVLLASGIGGAPLRYRGRLPQEGLAMNGVHMDVRMYRDVDVPRLARTADAVVLYRVPATEQILDLVSMVRSRPGPVPVLYDIDDLVVDPDLHSEIDPLLEVLDPEDRRRYWQGVARYRTTLESADAFVGSTEPLCEAVHELTGMPVHRFANGVGQRLAEVSDHFLRQPRRPGPLRIGYLSGTNTHNADWASIEGAVIDVLEARPDVEVWLGGLLDVSPRMDAFAARTRRMPLMSWHELPSVLRDLDVNLAPLNVGTRFNEAKSAIKHLEAALVETPTVASPTQPFREAITPGVNGYLADTSADWTALLLHLLDEPELRSSMGQRARSQVLLDLSPVLQGRRYLEVLRSVQAHVAEHGHRPMLEQFTAETENEPFFAWAPDPYDPAPWLIGGGHPDQAGPRTMRRVLTDYRARAVEHLTTEGVAATARKAASVAGSVPRRAAGRLAR